MTRQHFLYICCLSFTAMLALFPSTYVYTYLFIFYICTARLTMRFRSYIQSRVYHPNFDRAYVEGDVRRTHPNATSSYSRNPGILGQ